MFHHPSKRNAPPQHTHKHPHPSAAPLTDHLPQDAILALQRTIGNAATQRLLTGDNRDQTSIIALQPIIGNAGVQRLLRSPAAPAAPAAPRTDSSVVPLQRRLSITSQTLETQSGKKKKTGIKKLADNSAASTFRAIQKALDKYHEVVDSDIKLTQECLELIINNSNKWLSDIDHLQLEEEQKRTSLTELVRQAQLEIKRIMIIDRLGIPRDIAYTFNASEVGSFSWVVNALDKGNVQTGMILFDQFKSVLGKSAGLVEQAIKRNYIGLFDPALVGAMNDPKFKLGANVDGSAAIQQVKDQAQAKLDRLEELEKQKTTDVAALTAPGSTFKQADFPILNDNTDLGKEFRKLKFLKDQYEGIVSGKTVTDKLRDSKFTGFSEVELYALISYTSNLYSEINTAQRYHTGDDTKFTAGHRILTGATSSALHKLPAYNGQVFRHDSDYPGYAEKNAHGETVKNLAALSTAVNQAACASAGENHEVLEILQSKTGRDISELSVFGKKEAEVLFAPGSSFKVIAVFARNSAFKDKKHDISQWEIRGQEKKPKFKEAMDWLEQDLKKDQISRIVIKEEITS